MRQNVERAFGMMVKRWGIFWRPLLSSYSRWRLVISVCAQLHNLCIDGNCEELRPFPEDCRPGDIVEVHTTNDGNNGNGDAFAPNNALTCQSNDARRTKLTDHLRNHGWTRPIYS